MKLSERVQKEGRGHRNLLLNKTRMTNGRPSDYAETNEIEAVPGDTTLDVAFHFVLLLVSTRTPRITQAIRTKTYVASRHICLV